MSRVRALFLSTTAALIAAGCGVASYEGRLENSIKDLQYKQKVDANLTPAPTDPYKTLRVYARPPKPMTKMPSLVLNNVAGQWDGADTFSGAPVAEKASAEKGAVAPPALPPMRLHVLARIKKKPAAPKKGAAPAEPEPTRGKFVDDVRALMAAEFGPEAATAQAKAEIKKKNHFNRVEFTSPSSGDAIRAYLIEDKAGTEAALIFDIPQALLKNKMVTAGVEYCLETFALGRDADFRFGGGTISESGEVKGTAPAGPAF